MITETGVNKTVIIVGKYKNNLKSTSRNKQKCSSAIHLTYDEQYYCQVLGRYFKNSSYATRVFDMVWIKVASLPAQLCTCFLFRTALSRRDRPVRNCHFIACTRCDTNFDCLKILTVTLKLRIFFSAYIRKEVL